MRRLFVLPVVVATLVPPSPSQAVNPVILSIRFEGTKEFSDRELLGLLSSRVNLALNDAIIASDLRTLRSQYLRSGYLDVAIDVPARQYTSDSTGVDLLFTINEGRRSVVGHVEIRGDTVPGAFDLVRQFTTARGNPLNEQNLEEDIRSLLAHLERQGYPFAECSIAEMERHSGAEADSLAIVLELSAGPRLTIDEIRVEGNSETSASVVVRETRLSPGEVYNPRKIDAIRQRLSRLNIFADVSEPELYVRNGAGGLLIKVREGNTNTFDGVLGYVPGRQSGESGYVTGLVSISMRNLFGTGRKLSFRWQREDRLSQELGVRYLEPWVFGLPVNIGGGFFQRKQDTAYVRRTLDLKSELMLSEELSIGLLFGSESVIPSTDTIVGRVFRSSVVTFGGEVVYDTRDDLYSPTSGARYRTDYHFGRKRLSNIPPPLQASVLQRSSIQRFGLDLEFFLSTFSRQVLAIGLHWREIKGDAIEEGEMHRLGGSRTLRGYRESQFLGSRVAWSNTEYRFLLARRSFLYSFVDTGYFLRPADEPRVIPKTDGFMVGYGIGIQLETGLGNIGVSYALGKGDSFSTGKIHFGLINEF
jgi:outer membrane protein insertion porin family